MNQKLVAFVIERTHLKAEEIKSELRLAEDIGLHGLDAIVFLEDFFAEFEIKNAENFDADLYIDGGPDFAFQPIAWIKNIINKDRRKYLRPDVTLEHLEKVIEWGEWIDER